MDIITSPPERYWNFFLIFMAIILILVLIFDAWVFWSYSYDSDQNEPTSITNSASPELLKKSSFDSVLGRIKTKKENFERFKSNFTLEFQP